MESVYPNSALQRSCSRPVGRRTSATLLPSRLLLLFCKRMMLCWSCFGLAILATTAATAVVVSLLSCRETAVRTQSLIKFDAMADLLAAKDAMIWRLLQERTACTAEVEAVGRASSAEIEEWKRCVWGSA